MHIPCSFRVDIPSIKHFFVLPFFTSKPQEKYLLFEWSPLCEKSKGKLLIQRVGICALIFNVLMSTMFANFMG